MTYALPVALGKASRETHDIAINNALQALRVAVVAGLSDPDGAAEVIEEIEGLVVDAQTAAAASATSAAAAALFDGPWLTSQANIETDTTLSTTSGNPGFVPVGGYVRTRDGFVYQRVTTGEHRTTAGGVKLYALALNGVWPMLSLNPAADGVTNDSAKINMFNVPGAVVDFAGKDYAYAGAFVPVATFQNGRIIDNNRTRNYRARTEETFSTVGQRRPRINYNAAKSVRVDGLSDAIIMGGFRSFGSYMKSRGRMVPTGLGANSHAVVNIETQIAGLTTPLVDNWYAVFAVANDTDATCRFVIVPYLRALSVAGSVVTLGSNAENKNVSPSAVTYNVAANAFAGTDCLVLTEGGVVSRRVTTITANTTTTVTLADASGIGALDFLLPAPPNNSAYHYLGTAYFEAGGTGEWRNIADDGYNVRARMANITELPDTGGLTNVKVRLGGNISPLAAGFTGSLNASLSTASVGNVAADLRHDSSAHDIWRFLEMKEASGACNYNNMIDCFTFSREQAFWITTYGSLSGAEVARTLLVYGWQEP